MSTIRRVNRFSGFATWTADPAFGGQVPRYRYYMFWREEAARVWSYAVRNRIRTVYAHWRKQGQTE